MKTVIHHYDKANVVDLSKPLDISIPLRGNDKNPIAWYLGSPTIAPVRDGDFIGKVTEGSSTNFNNISFNPHGHGTHTECVGHITPEFHSINQAVQTFFFGAALITVTPEKQGEDLVIGKAQLAGLFKKEQAEALVIRSLPNTPEKLSRHYSHTNWPYLSEDAATYIRECGVEHLLIDLPSVDKEKDDGKLLAHKAFWNYPKNTRHQATITELIYVPEDIEDGAYMLNLQFASFENDASPSKPILYKLES